MSTSAGQKKLSKVWRGYIDIHKMKSYIHLCSGYGLLEPIPMKLLQMSQRVKFSKFIGNIMPSEVIRKPKLLEWFTPYQIYQQTLQLVFYLLAELENSFWDKFINHLESTESVAFCEVKHQCYLFLIPNKLFNQRFGRLSAQNDHSAYGIVYWNCPKQLSQMRQGPEPVLVNPDQSVNGPTYEQRNEQMIGLESSKTEFAEQQPRDPRLRCNKTPQKKTAAELQSTERETCVSPKKFSQRLPGQKFGFHTEVDENRYESPTKKYVQQAGGIAHYHQTKAPVCESELSPTVYPTEFQGGGGSPPYHYTFTSTPKSHLRPHVDRHQPEAVGCRIKLSPAYKSNPCNTEPLPVHGPEYYRPVKAAAPGFEVLAKIPIPVSPLCTLPKLHAPPCSTASKATATSHRDPDKPLKSEMEATKIAIQKWQDATEHAY